MPETDKAPKFDPSQPYSAVVAQPPAETAKFDPSQPYSSAQDGDDEQKKTAAPEHEKTFHSNPLAPQQWTELSPEKQKQQELTEPAKHAPIPKAVQVGMEAIPWAPLAEEGIAASAAGRLLPFAKSAARGLAGSFLGSAGGAWLGREVGGLFGQGKTGGEIGGLAGGLYGGYKGFKGEPVSIPSLRGMARTAMGEAGGVQIPEKFPGPPMEPPPPVEETAGIPGEAATERLRAHRGDVRTPIPAIPTIRRGPGEILPETVSSGAEPRVGPPPTSGNTVLPGGAVIKRPPIALLPEYTPSAPLPARPLNPPAAELPRVSSIDRLKSLIQTEGAGTPPLQKNVPLGEQLFTPRKPATEMPSVGQKVSDVINQNTETEAVRPLASGPQKGTKLRDITEPPAEPIAHRATVTHEGKTFGMEAANGRAMFEATQHDAALAKAVHDLRNNDVRQAFLNAGGDVNTVGMEGQRFKVGNTTSKERSQMFDYMLKKGLKPEEIIKLARQRNP